MSYPFTFKNWFLDGVQLVKETIDDTKKRTLGILLF